LNGEQAEKKISIKGIDELKLFGLQDRNLRRLQKDFNIKVSARGQELLLIGDSSNVTKAVRAVEELISIVSRDKTISENDLDTIFALTMENGRVSDGDVEVDGQVILYKKDGFIKPKSQGQQNFFEASQNSDIVFAVGPAGTGKTFLAVAFAVAALRDKLVDRIVLTRPAVEAGESLGYLPGDFREKIDPYLHDMIPPDKLKRYLEAGIIEIVPLAYMRGRTLNNAFVILDEAQNTTFNQMKMFLTRLGLYSRAIVTGDVSQIDLPDRRRSGLVQVQEILTKIEGIEFVYMEDKDVVRHKLVRDIIKAYEKYEGKDENGNAS